MPIKRWNLNEPKFGQSEFELIYRSKPESSKNLFLVHTQLNSSEWSAVRGYISCKLLQKTSEINLNCTFKTIKKTNMPGISTLLDELSRKLSIETDEDRLDTNDNFETNLTFCLSSIVTENPMLPKTERTDHYIQAQRNFKEAWKSTKWSEAIDTE